MNIKREWAMPNSGTFLIKPVKVLLDKYIKNGENWIDPFAGENSPVKITNDLNPEIPTKYHLKALDFLKKLKGNKYNGILFDPPYSLRQLKECYQNIGYSIMKEESNYFPFKEKKMASSLIKVGGYAICFGWNSIGFGKSNGFELIEVLLICHGRGHNDTIITVEIKIQDNLFNH